MEAKELFNIIKTRRTVMPNLYNEEEISPEELNQILDSANWAPTHKHTEPGRFIVLQNEARPRFAEFMLTQYDKNTAPEKLKQRKRESIREKCLKSDKIILICLKSSGIVPDWEEIASVAAGVQNMWLMCTALKIGSYWSTPGAISNVNEFTKLDENERCIGIFYMGKLNMPLYDGHRIPFEEKIRFVSN